MKEIIFSEQLTARTETMAIYMHECNRYKVMDNDAIISALKDGKKDAVVNANLKLVISVAKRYQNCGLSLDDLVQEGNIGLVCAVNAYNPNEESEYKFITFALQYIVKYICLALTTKSRTVRLPKIDMSYLESSFDEPLGNSEDGHEKTLADTFASTERADSLTNEDDMKKKIRKLLNGLSEREKGVIIGLFALDGHEETNYTLSLRYGLTEERIRQIKMEALEKMRNL